MRVRLPRLITLSGLVMVTVLEPLSRPTPVCWKLSTLGWNRTEPGTPPVPLRGTLAEAAREDAMVSVPVNSPLREGEKMTPIEQLAPEARLAPQLFWAT